MRRGIAGIVALLATAVLAAGCADSGFHYVKSSQDKTYFKVPERWTLYDEHALIAGMGSDLTKSQRHRELSQTWKVGFDAAPKPSLTHLGAAAGHPAGLAVVRKLSFNAADQMSNSVLRNYFFDVDTALQDGTGKLQKYEELQLAGGFRGVHLVADLDTNGTKMTIDQTTLLDQATTKVYAVVVSCSADCYSANKGEIESVVDSWTVRNK